MSKVGFVSFFQVHFLVDVFYPLYLIYHRVLNAFKLRGVVNLKLLFTVLDSVTFCDIPRVTMMVYFDMALQLPLFLLNYFVFVDLSLLFTHLSDG